MTQKELKMDCNALTIQLVNVDVNQELLVPFAIDVTMVTMEQIQRADVKVRVFLLTNKEV